jgi:hypothetical protein
MENVIGGGAEKSRMEHREMGKEGANRKKYGGVSVYGGLNPV